MMTPHESVTRRLARFAIESDSGFLNRALIDAAKLRFQDIGRWAAVIRSAGIAPE
jgi:hypothetical protein